MLAILRKKHRWILVLAALVLSLTMGLSAMAAAYEPEEERTEPTGTEAGNPPPAGESKNGETGEAGEDTEKTTENPGEAGKSTPDATTPTPPENGDGTSEEGHPGSGPQTDGTPAGDEEENSTEDDANPDEAEEEQPAESYGLETETGAIVVYSYDELKKALSEDNGYTTIYLGNDISADSTGVTIHPQKTAVVIDGRPPDAGEAVRYTFTQAVSTSATLPVRVDAAGTTREVTLRNMVVAGGNHYGVVLVPDALTGVVLVHENVRYTGPQAFYNRGGTVRVINSSYTLQQTGGIATGELAEAQHVEMGGTVTIGAAATGNGIIWFIGAGSTLVLLPDAQVSINTATYFIYTNGYQTDVTFMPGASLALTSGTFGFTYADQRIGTFIMNEGAALDIRHNTRESYAALRVAKLFQMNPGSSATIIRTGTAGIPLRLTNANAKAVFNQPQRVFLYSSAGVPLRFTGAGTLEIITQALNVWKTTPWPAAGGVDTLPSHIWNKAGSTPLQVVGSYTETTSNSLKHNLDMNDPVVSTLDANSFDLEGSQLVAFGTLSLGIDIPYSTSPSLTGSTTPGAQVGAGYTLADGRGGQITGTAGADGRYTLAGLGGQLAVGSQVTVVASYNQLAVRQRQTVLDSTMHTLAFLEVPDMIDFGSLPVPGGAATVNRQNTPFSITVADTRLSPTPWRLDASLPQPMAAMAGGVTYQLPGAVVFADHNGVPVPLSAEPLTVYRQPGGVPGETTIQWGVDEGVLLKLLPGQVYSGVNYHATIHWTLVDAP